MMTITMMFVSDDERSSMGVSEWYRPRHEDIEEPRLLVTPHRHCRKVISVHIYKSNELLLTFA